MHPTEGAEDLESLDCQLACRHYQQGTETIIRCPPLLEKSLNDGQEVAQSLTGAGTSADDCVSAGDPMRDGSTLHIGELHKLGLEEPGHRGLRDGQVTKPDLNLLPVLRL